MGERTSKPFQKVVCVSLDIVRSGHITISILEVKELQFTVRILAFEEEEEKKKKRRVIIKESNYDRVNLQLWKAMEQRQLQ